MAAGGSAPSLCTGGVRANMTRLFISHSSADDDFVQELQQALGDLDQELQLDSRQLRGGDPLWSEVQDAIEEASAFAVLVSPNAMQSPWVGKELSHAIELRRLIGRDNFPVISLSRGNTSASTLTGESGEELDCIAVPSAAGGAGTTAHLILAALGKRSPMDAPDPGSVAPPILSRLADSPRQGEDQFESAIKAGNAWDHEQFQTHKARVEQQVESGQLSEAFDGARQLLQRALAAGETAYLGADFDLAGAGFLLGLLFEKAGEAERASTLFGEAQKRFEAIAQQQTHSEAERTEDIAATAEARQKSIQCYIAYRRNGGENDSGTGRLVVDMTKALRASGTSVAAEFLDELAADPRATGSFCTFIQALQAVVKGSRDRRLANAPDLDCTMAAEVLFLIESLEQRR